MLRVLLFLILIISLSSSSLYADTNPFRFLNDSPRNKRYINFICNKADLKKFRGATKIGYINLSIKDFNHESGDAKALGVKSGYDSATKSYENQEALDNFIEIIKKHNAGREVALQIGDDGKEFHTKCYDEGRKNSTDYANVLSKCRSKQKAYLLAKYGNAIGQFYYNFKIKGTTFPILVKSKYSVSLSGEIKYNNEEYQLTDINYLEESTVKQGLLQLMDQHIETLSEIFEIAQICK